MYVNEKEFFEGFLSMSKAFFLTNIRARKARTKPTYLLKSSSCTFIYAVSSPAASKVIIQKSHREVAPLEDKIDCEYLGYFEPNEKRYKRDICNSLVRTL